MYINQTEHWLYIFRRKLFHSVLKEREKVARKLRNFCSILVPFQSKMDMHFEFGVFSRIFRQFSSQFTEKMYHIELLKMAIPCECVLCLLFAIHLIEVWQETLRAKFKTKNWSAFPSDCTTINYSVFTRFACILVENNNHENIYRQSIVQCSTTPLWIGDVEGGWNTRDSLYIGRWWKSKMSAKRTLCVRASSSSRKKSLILGGVFFGDFLTYLR